MVLEGRSVLSGEVESGNITIYWNWGRGLAVYNIYRFGREGRAVTFYDRFSDVDIFREHSSINFESHFADEYTIGCGNSEFGGYRCGLVARYEEFVVSLVITPDNEMSLEQFEELMSYIDERLGTLLAGDRAGRL
jgi:hypothetical protein